MVAQALEQGHQVIALVRSRRKLNTGRPNLRATKSNMLDYARLSDRPCVGRTRCCVHRAVNGSFMQARFIQMARVILTS